MPNTSLLIDLSEGQPARHLSETGLFTNITRQTLAPGIIPYTVNSPFWSDGAFKNRYFALPYQSEVELSPKDPWIFPPNTILVKTFSLEFVRGDSTSRQPIETRFMVKDSAKEAWRGFSYDGNEDGTEAYLLDESQHKTFFIVDPSAPESYTEQRYFYPGPKDCSFCHREAAGRALETRTGQLNGDFTYS